MPGLGNRIDLAGWGLLLMKGTTTPEILSPLLKTRALGKQIDEVVGLTDASDIFFGKSHIGIPL